MGKVKKQLMCLLCLALSIISNQTLADIAIVLDDSTGMCGYLDTPIENNRYKQMLNILETARIQSGLKANIYFLSDLKHSRGNTGDEVDKIVRADGKKCPYNATASHIDEAMSQQLGKANTTILITDLLFDDGSGGASTVRDGFVNAFAKLASDANADWFNTSAGLIGVTSIFNGNYFSNHGDKVHLQNTNRPFYVIWKTRNQQESTKFFDAFSTSFWQLKGTQDALAIKLLPLTESITQSKSFISHAPKPWYELAKSPQFFYSNKQNKRLTDKELEKEGINPKECLSSNPQSIFDIVYSKSCGENGAKENFFYNKSLISGIQFWYAIENDTSKFSRKFSITTQTKKYQNNANIIFNDSGILLQIAGGIHGYSSVFNGKHNDPFIILVQEFYSAIETNKFDYSKIRNWSSEKEPCETMCDSNGKTFKLEMAIKSIIERLNTNIEAANHLNQSVVRTPKEIKLLVGN